MANDANIIKIKRSGTSGAPASLKLGELAYSYLTASGNPTSNGGDRLFIGANGVNGGTGNANDVIVIGGKYFTDLLDHQRGILTASSGIITDSNSKIDRLLTTNIAIGGISGGGLDQTISVTNTNGGLILKANGTGLVSVDGTYGLVLPVGTSSNRGTGVQGEVRYNTTITGFEGYNGSNWSSLGGVRSVDGNAYIIAETSPGAGDDTLHFYAGTSGSPGTSISVADWSTTTLTVKTILTATTANKDISLGASTGTGVTTINSGALGSLDHITIGGNTAAAGTFTTLTANTTNKDISLGASTGTGVTAINSGALGSLDHITIGGTTPAAGSFTGFTVNATGSTFTVNPATIGSLDNITIGANKSSAGTFTSITDTGLTATYVTFAGTGGLLSDSANLTYASGTFTIADTTASSDATHGALVVSGGVGIGGDLHVYGVINAYSASFDSINSTPIGNVTPSTGAFTTLTVDNTTGNNVTLNPATTGTIDNITIGGTTAAAGTFTTATANKFLANEGSYHDGDNGYSFTGDSGNDTGMFSSTDGHVQLAANGVLIAQYSAAPTGDPKWIFTAPVTFSNALTGGYTLPVVDGSNQYSLTTNGNGTVSWTAVVNSITAGTNLNTTSNATTGDVTVNLATTLTGLTEVDVGNLKLSGTAVSSASSSGSVNINTSPDGMTVHNWEFNTDGTTAFNNAAYTFPSASAGSGNAQYILADTTGNGTLAWTSTTLTINGDTSSTSTLQLLSQALTFAGGTTPITVTVSDQTVTVNIADATYSTLGLASFDTTYFTVTAGNATITASSIGNDRLANNTISGISLGSNLDDLTVGTNLNFTSTNSTYNGGTAQTINLDNEITLTTVNANTVNSTAVNAGDLSLSGSTIENSSTTGDIVLVANNGGSDKTYTFGGDGNLNVAGKITNVTTPTDDYDAANKIYVDSVAQGLHIHDPAKVTTYDTLAVLSGGTVSYNNGSSGVGAYFTLATPLTVIDNYTLQDKDRILVKNETTTSQNGVYVWHTGGTNLTRATDFDTPPEVAGGDFIFVEHGTVGGSTGWVQTQQNLATIGTDSITFKQFAGAGTYIAGDGLLLNGNSFKVNAGNGLDTSGTGNALEVASSIAGNGLTYSSGVINVVGTSNRISVSADAIDISTSYVGQSTITTLGTITTGTWNATTIDATHGGTGQTTWAKGDLLYASATNTLTKLTAGTNGQTLQLQDGLPVWSDLDGGTY
jgi:hypothetical protein